MSFIHPASLPILSTQCTDEMSPRIMINVHNTVWLAQPHCVVEVRDALSGRVLKRFEVVCFNSFLSNQKSLRSLADTESHYSSDNDYAEYNDGDDSVVTEAKKLSNRKTNAEICAMHPHIRYGIVFIALSDGALHAYSSVSCSLLRTIQTPSLSRGSLVHLMASTANHVWTLSGDHTLLQRSLKGRIRKRIKLPSSRQSSHEEVLAMIIVQQYLWLATSSRINIWSLKGAFVHALDISSAVHHHHHHHLVCCLVDVSAAIQHKVWAGTTDGKICVWDTQSMRFEAAKHIHQHRIVSMCVRNKNAYSVDESGSLCVWRIPSISLIAQCNDTTNMRVSCALVAPCCLWLSSSECLRVIELHEESARTLHDINAESMTTHTWPSVHDDDIASVEAPYDARETSNNHTIDNIDSDDTASSLESNATTLEHMSYASSIGPLDSDEDMTRISHKIVDNLRMKSLSSIHSIHHHSTQQQVDHDDQDFEVVDGVADDELFELAPNEMMENQSVKEHQEHHSTLHQHTASKPSLSNSPKSVDTDVTHRLFAIIEQAENKQKSLINTLNKEREVWQRSALNYQRELTEAHSNAKMKITSMRHKYNTEINAVNAKLTQVKKELHDTIESTQIKEKKLEKSYADRLRHYEIESEKSATALAQLETCKHDAEQRCIHLEEILSKVEREHSFKEKQTENAMRECVAKAKQALVEQGHWKTELSRLRKQGRIKREEFGAQIKEQKQLRIQDELDATQREETLHHAIQKIRVRARSREVHLTSRIAVMEKDLTSANVAQTRYEEKLSELTETRRERVLLQQQLTKMEEEKNRLKNMALDCRRLHAPFVERSRRRKDRHRLERSLSPKTHSSLMEDEDKMYDDNINEDRDLKVLKKRLNTTKVAQISPPFGAIDINNGGYDKKGGYDVVNHDDDDDDESNDAMQKVFTPPFQAANEVFLRDNI